MTDAEKAKYAYKAKLMNDVHMSHNMEFAYPQSMASCVTCHANKLDQVLADSKFTKETCKSCHAVDKLAEKMSGTRNLVLARHHHPSLFPGSAIRRLRARSATDASGAPTIAKIHNGGYNPKIYSSTGVRYSDTFKVTVDARYVDRQHADDPVQRDGSHEPSGHCGTERDHADGTGRSVRLRLEGLPRRRARS